MRRTLALVTLAVLLGAGCLAKTGGPSPGATQGGALAFRADWAAHALAPGADGHDHSDPKQHADMSTPNFQLLGWDGMSTDYFGKTAGGYLCGEGATTKEGKHLAVVSSFTTDIAFVLVDVTDSAHPQKIGEYALKGVKSYDTALTPDGKHVLIGADNLGGNEDPRFAGEQASPGLFQGALTRLTAARTMPVHLEFTDACTGETKVGPEEQLPLAPGVVMVGVADPKNPVLEDFQPTPVIGPHSVSTARVDNVTYVTASITNLVHAASYFNFYELVDTPAASRLVLLSTVDAQQYGEVLTGFSALGNGHVDVALAKHPVTKKLTAYLCDWDGGLVVLDLSVPNAPMLLGAWADKQVDGGAVHSAVPIEGTWDGRHYVFVGQEFVGRPSDRPSGWIYVLDDTDPSAIKEVSRWTLPVDTQSNWGRNELFSTHYFNYVNRTLFVTMYHGGVWAVDLSTPAEPKTVGVFVPANVPEKPPKVDWKGQIRGWPYVLDVMPFPDGTVATFDATSGVYVFRFDASHPAPAVPEWPMKGKPHAGE